MKRKTDGQIERQTGVKKYRWTDRQKDRQTVKLSDRWTDRQTTDRQMKRKKMVRKTDGQTNI